jgi:hypothetical protein
MNGMNEGDEPKLERALRGFAKNQVFVPPEIDEQVLRQIQAQFEAPSESAGKAKTADLIFRRSPRKLKVRRKPRAWERWIPLAASIVIAGLMLFFSVPRDGDVADLNRDGKVDIIDALLAAEEMAAGHGRDVNGDRKINERDANEIADRAVRLGRSGS